MRRSRGDARQKEALQIRHPFGNAPYLWMVCPHDSQLRLAGVMTYRAPCRGAGAAARGLSRARAQQCCRADNAVAQTCAACLRRRDPPRPRSTCCPRAPPPVFPPRPVPLHSAPSRSGPCSTARPGRIARPRCAAPPSRGARATTGCLRGRAAAATRPGPGDRKKVMMFAMICPLFFLLLI